MGLAVRRLYKLFWLPIIVLGLYGCGQLQPLGSSTRMIHYTVKPGDTLYSISWRYGYDHRQVAGWNNIRSPYTIYAGQTLRIIPPRDHQVRSGPTPAERAAVSRPAPSSTASTSASPRTSPPSQQQSTPPRQTTQAQPQAQPTQRPAPQSTPRPAPSPRSAATAKVDWQWPTRGEQKYRFNQNGKKGLGIGGSLGQAIRAAADGEVVYSGSGLIGYGNLLIIKHNDIYLSAYGHNRRLLVEEGTQVKRGQKIAEMGESNRDGVILHFEIRRDGTPVNPTGYLPGSGS